MTTPQELRDEVQAILGEEYPYATPQAGETDDEPSGAAGSYGRCCVPSVWPARALRRASAVHLPAGRGGN